MRRHLALLSLTVLIGCAEAYPSDFGDPEGQDEVDSSIPNNTQPDASVAFTPDAAVLPQYNYDSGTSSSYDSGTSSSYDAGGTADSGTGTGTPTDFIGQLLGTFTGFLGGGAKDAGADASP